MNKNNCVSIFNTITTIGDVRTEFYNYDDCDNVNDNTLEKNNLVSVLDIIDNYPSHQCSSVTNILNILFPIRNPLDNTCNLILRMYALKLNRDNAIRL